MLPIIGSSQTNTSPSTKNRPIEQGLAPKVSYTSNKVFFISLGCPRNLVDTEVMIGILLKAGYEVAQQLEGADYIIINTCGFLEASRQESIDTIQHAITSSKRGAKVIATGCMVQNHKEILQKECPELHYLLGSGDVTKILEAVEAKQRGVGVTDARSYLESGEVPRVVSTPKSYAYIKIAEGCRKRCSFCIIPDIKGSLKSKSIEQILKEIRILVDTGVQEVILIAQDLGDWGRDMGYHKTDGLLLLLKTIMEKETRDFRLRLMYLYPDEITDELLDLIAREKRICRYVDMPLQHVNDTILQAMRRTTNKAHIQATIEKIRHKLPDMVIRTSLMVGFPGETEEQFLELQQFIQEHPIDNIGIFTYSKEELSHSATLPGHIAQEVKDDRFKRLAATQQKVLKKLFKKYKGKKLEVLIEGYHPETQLLLRGRHEGQAPEVDGIVLINDFRKVKEFHKRYLVEITEISGYDLVGKVIG